MTTPDDAEADLARAVELLRELDANGCEVTFVWAAKAGAFLAEMDKQ